MADFKYVNFLLESLLHFYENNLHCDTIIQLKDGSILIHSIILAAISPKFNNILNLKKRIIKNSSIKLIISLKKWSIKVTGILFKYLYTGIMDHSTFYDNKEDLICLIQVLGIDEKNLFKNFLVIFPSKSENDNNEQENVNNIELQPNLNIINNRKFSAGSIHNKQIKPILITPEEYPDLSVKIAVDNKIASTDKMVNKVDSTNAKDTDMNQFDNLVECSQSPLNANHSVLKKSNMVQNNGFPLKVLENLNISVLMNENNMQNGIEIKISDFESKTNNIGLDSNQKTLKNEKTLSSRIIDLNRNKFKKNQILVLKELSKTKLKEKYSIEKICQSFEDHSYAPLVNDKVEKLNNQNINTFQECKKCNDKFFDHSEFLHHLAVHPIKDVKNQPISCTICSLEFNKLNLFLNHFELSEKIKSNTVEKIPINSNTTNINFNECHKTLNLSVEEIVDDSDIEEGNESDDSVKWTPPPLKKRLIINQSVTNNTNLVKDVNYLKILGGINMGCDSINQIKNKKKSIVIKRSNFEYKTNNISLSNDKKTLNFEKNLYSVKSEVDGNQFPQNELLFLKKLNSRKLKSRANYLAKKREEKKVQLFSEHSYTPLLNDKIQKLNYKKITNTFQECAKCNEKFYDHSEFLDHLTIHPLECDKNQPISCTICSLEYKRLRSFLNHFERSEKAKLRTLDNIPNKSRVKTVNVDKGYKCHICARSFNEERFLRHHLGCHKEKTYLCSLCPSRFRFNGSLRRHLSSIHDLLACKLCSAFDCKCENKTEKELKCHICKQLFTRKELLESHVIDHINPCEYKCSICQRQYKNIRSLKAHEFKHNLVWTCSLCDKTFNSEMTLEEHYKEHNSPDYPLSCPICQKGFLFLGNMTKHMIKTHPNPLDKCKICDIQLCNRYSYRKHMMRHVIDRSKNFKCNVCSKSYYSLDMLKSHKKLHLPLSKRTFKCRFCDTVKYTTLNLLVHEKGHDEANFIHVCTQADCGSKFVRKCDLNKHIKEKHNRSIKPLPRKYPTKFSPLNSVRTLLTKVN